MQKSGPGELRERERESVKPLDSEGAFRSFSRGVEQACRAPLNITADVQ